MATRWVLKNSKIYSGGYDLSGASNTVNLTYAYDEVPVKGFGLATNYSVPGLPALTFELEGDAYANGSNESDDVLWSQLGTVNVPLTVAPTTGAAGEVAYFTKQLVTTYDVGGAIGEMYAFTAKGSGQSALIRGTVMHSAAVTSTSTGTARQLGAVTAAQSLYCQMHVLAVSGTNPTLDVIVASDDAQGFASGTTRATFTQATAVGSQALTAVAGPITDDWWRAGFTIGGTNTPSFTIALVVGIF